MKKSALQNLSYEDQTFFKEHLRRTAIELYEWSLLLYWLWLSDLYHHRTEIASGKLVDVDVIHDPKIHTFPPIFDDLTRLSIKRKCDAEFHKVSQDDLKDFSGSPYFPENAEKEYAVMYLLGNHFEARKDVPLESKNSFHLLSIEARCLSIIYEHFSEYRKKLNWLDWDLYIEIHSLKEDVVGDCHELIGYWKLSDIKKKIQTVYGRKGGQVEKKLPGILLATRWALNNGRNKSALSLWKYLRRELKDGERVFGEFEIGFDKEKNYLYQVGKFGNDKPIRFRGFQNYVHDVKKYARK